MIKSFVQTHSIAKRLVFGILIIALFFMFEFVGLYFINQNSLVALAELNQTIRAITQVRQLRQILTNQLDYIKRSSVRNLTTEELLLFQKTCQQMENLFAINLDLTRDAPDARHLISEARITLNSLTDSYAIVNSGKSAGKINLLIIEQYHLEAQDLLGKVQIVIAEDSNEIFNGIYESRFTPLIVGISLSIFALLFALMMGINFKNKIESPIAKLVNATKKLADGDLTVRAPIVEANEVGALTHVFNVMASRLEESVKEREKSAQSLLEAKEAAEAANMAKSAFLANMSHEIRTPLGAVLGFAELINDPQIQPFEKINLTAAMKRNGELLSDIINDILDLSKIEANKMEISKYDTPLIEILNDTKTLLSLKAKEKGIALVVEVAPDVPQFIKTDPLRLRQILINIIGNAIKFTTKGSVDVQVTTRPTPEKNILAIVVKDMGIGIDSDHIKKLFAPFSQADATMKRKFGGTGLGLILSKRFAHLLGGDVVLTETQVNRGSTFTITIDPGPLNQTVILGEKITTLDPQRQGLRLEGIKVLLAEDSPDNQFLVTRLLKLAGAQVDVVNNGQEAVDKASVNDFNVVLMDLQMPVMDGYEATAELRRRGYKGQIIALTAHTLSEERDRCLRSGFNDHIGKPINRSILLDRVLHSAEA